MEINRVIWAKWVMAYGCFTSKIERLLSEEVDIAIKCYYRHLIVCYILLIGVFSFSSSVYTIGHNDGAWNPQLCPFNAFDIVNDQFVFRGSVDLPKRGTGGIALANDELTNTLFVTFENDEYGEGGNVIEIVNARTLQHIARTIAGVTNLTSIVFDTQRRKLYATDRDTNLLHVLGYNPAQKTVWPEKTIELDNIENACGLSISDDLLYVSEFYYAVNSQPGMVYYSEVNCYKISEDFAYVESIDMGDKTVAIDYDPVGNILYGGAYAYTGQYQHLIKNPLDDPNGLLQKDIGAGVIGIACDNTIAGRVFLTTYRNHVIEGKENYGSIEMWDTADWQAEPNTLPITEVTAIYDDLNTDGANMSSLSGIIVTEPPKSPIQVVKTDNVGTCISPESFDPNVVYTVGVSDPNGQTNLWIVDHLPREVDFVSASPQDQNYGYDLQTHTYTWYLPYLTGYDPNDPNSIPGGDPNEYFTLTARVNGWAEPKSSFINLVTAESAVSYGWTAVETDVCWWGGDVIYVDKNAPGPHIGTTWETAYLNLTDALDRAASASFDPNLIDIFVTDGVYKPGTDAGDSFDVPDGIEVYGGFAGWETSIDQRNIKANPTVLSGYIGPDTYGNTLRSKTVVTMGANSLLNGFTVRDSGALPAEGYAINGEGVDYTVENCVIEDNLYYGLYASSGNLTVKWCTIQNNGYDGIRHLGNNSKTIVVENCQIQENGQSGIRTVSSIPVIRNNQISLNGADDSDTFYGLYIVYPKIGYDVRNNTVVYNANEGIRAAAVDANEPVNIYNSILYGNKTGEDEQLKGDITAYYSCVYDPNNIHATPDGSGNISCDPQFAYDGNPNMTVYRLLATSPCVDKGDNTGVGWDEKDLDNENRIYNSIVDMGADEAYACDDNLSDDDVYNPLDWNADGLVNMEEFTTFSRVWLSVSPDPNYNPAYDFDSDLDIDLGDLQTFVRDVPWLWQACWRTDILEMQQMSMLALSGVEGMTSGGEQCVLSEVEGMTSFTPLISMEISQPVETTVSVPVTESVEVVETDPVAEREQVLSLLEDVEVFIDAGGDDAEAWRKIKNLLEQTLVITEDTANEPNEI